MLNKLLERYPALKDTAPEIESAIKAIIETYKNNGKVLLAGNGGSASDCEHMAGELMKSFVRKRKIDKKLKDKLIEIDSLNGEYIGNTLESPLKAVALTSHPSLSTAYSNDRDPYLVFAQQLLGFGESGDIFIAFSTSGNSKNILYTTTLAKAMGIKIISMTGKNGGALSLVSDIRIKAPSNETYRIQEYHLPIYHTICLEVEKYFFTEIRE